MARVFAAARARADRPARCSSISDAMVFGASFAISSTWPPLARERPRAEATARNNEANAGVDGSCHAVGSWAFQPPNTRST